MSEETAEMLANHPIDVVEADVSGVRNGEDGWLKALEFEDSVGHRPTGSRIESGDGDVREYKSGFAMYGAEYNNGL